MRAIRRFTVRVTLPEPLAALLGLMLNLRWSWHAPTAELFASIDPDAWQAAGGDPIAMLSAVPTERMAALAGDPDFLARLHEAEQGLRDYMSGPRWYADAGLVLRVDGGTTELGAHSASDVTGLLHRAEAALTIGLSASAATAAPIA